MRILHILNSRIYSGAEHVVCTIIRNMPSNYECIYMSPCGEIEDKLTQLKIAYYRIQQLTPSAIRKAVKELSPDMVHAHDFRASVYAAQAVKGSVKCISHIHCNPDWLGKVHPNNILYAAASHKFQNILTVSDAFVEQYRWKRTIQNKVEVIGNPFSVMEVIRKAEKQPLEYDIAFVGRFEKEKNPLGFIDIIKAVQEKNCNVSAVMVGDGSLKEVCADSIHNKNLQDYIEMVGFQNNPYTWIAKSKVVIIPSKWEGFGLVALEAMALGKPVLASPAGGLKQLVNTECGLLCSSVKEFADELIRLLYDEKYYYKKSQEAKKRAERFDNIDSYMKQLLDIYGKDRN